MIRLNVIRQVYCAFLFLALAVSFGSFNAPVAHAGTDQADSAKKKKKRSKKRKTKKVAPSKKTQKKQQKAGNDETIVLPTHEIKSSKPAPVAPEAAPKKSKQDAGLVLELVPEPAPAAVVITTKPLELVPTPAPALDVLDFGDNVEEDPQELTRGKKNRFAFEEALSHMAAADYGKAADGFFRILAAGQLVDFHSESQYQLAKALFRSGLYGEAFARFRVILHEGPAHRRFQKSVEWLFRLSRVSPEQEPILRELARFRNMRFPEAYRDEYHYLLAKHFFFVARRYEREEARQANSENIAAEDIVSEEMAFTGNDASDSSETVMQFEDTSRPDPDVVFEFGENTKAAAGVMEFGARGKAASPGGTNLFKARAPETMAEAVTYAHLLLERVSSETEFYPRGMYLRGLLHYLAGDDQSAVETYRTLVALLHPSTGKFSRANLRHMAFLSLARIHYEHEQFDKSIYYYSRIPQGAPTWLTALFESSWAYFRRGDFDKALGRLLTLHSPFFASEYFPESQVVKAIIYFEACRFEEARIIVDDFFGRYNPMMEKVRAMLDTREEVDAATHIYQSLGQGRSTKEGESPLTSRLLGLARADPRVAEAEKTLAQLLKERELIQTLLGESELVEELERSTDKRISEQRRIAAEAMLLKFEDELVSLRELLSQSIKVKLEVARAERESIQRKLRGEVSATELKSRKSNAGADSQHVRWPYQGEYWRDELGTYVVDFNMCEPSDAH